MVKRLQERVCQDCGAKFEGNPRARYCPQCRSYRKEKKTYQEVKQEQPGVFGRMGNVIKKYMSFTQMAILNAILLIVGFGVAWYLHSQPFSLANESRMESLGTVNYALTMLIVWGVALRGFYWYRERKGDNPFWKQNYWKQLFVWLLGIICTVVWGLVLMVL